MVWLNTGMYSRVLSLVVVLAVIAGTLDIAEWLLELLDAWIVGYGGMGWYALRCIGLEDAVGFVDWGWVVPYSGASVSDGCWDMVWSCGLAANESYCCCQCELKWIIHASFYVWKYLRGGVWLVMFLRKTFCGLEFGGGVVVEEVCYLVGMAGCRVEGSGCWVL